MRHGVDVMLGGDAVPWLDGRPREARELVAGVPRRGAALERVWVVHEVLRRPEVELQEATAVNYRETACRGVLPDNVS